MVISIMSLEKAFSSLMFANSNSAVVHNFLNLKNYTSSKSTLLDFSQLRDFSKKHFHQRVHVRFFCVYWGKDVLRA